MRINRTAVAALATVAIAGIGTGSALAATGTTKAATAAKVAKAASATPAQDETALIAALATKLGISSDSLTTALKAVAKDKVAAALKAGTITQAQADAANARIDAGNGLLAPGLGQRAMGGPGMGGVPGFDADDLQVAADYLGVKLADLQTAIQGGKTLATVATANSKTAAGLEDALVAAETKEINADANLTAAQKTQMISNLAARYKAAVENAAPALGQGGPGFGGPRGGHGHGGHGMDGGFGPLGGSSSGSSSNAPLSAGTGA